MAYNNSYGNYSYDDDYDSGSSPDEGEEQRYNDHHPPEKPQMDSYFTIQDFSASETMFTHKLEYFTQWLRTANQASVIHSAMAHLNAMIELSFCSQQDEKPHHGRAGEHDEPQKTNVENVEDQRSSPALLKPLQTMDVKEYNQLIFVCNGLSSIIKTILDNKLIEEASIAECCQTIGKILQGVLCELKPLRNKELCINTTEEDPDKVITRISILLDIISTTLSCRGGTPFAYHNLGLYLKNPQLLQSDTQKYNTGQNGDKNFMQNYQDYVFASPTLAKPSKKEVPLSTHFIYLVNTFGQCGGLKLLLDWLELDKLNITLYSKVLTCLSYFVDAPLVQKVLEEIVNKVRDRCTSYVLTLDDDLMKVYDKSQISSLLCDASSILQKLNPAKVPETMDTLQLELAFKYFTARSIDKRLQGLAEIKSIAKDVFEEEIRSTSLQQKINIALNVASSAQNSKWITLKYLHKWMDDKKLFECFFKDIHAEVIRLSKPIVLFLSHSRGLRQSEIELIWKASVGKHEATQRLIFDFIIDMIPSLPTQTINALFELIETLSLRSLNIHTLDFIKEFAMEAMLNIMKEKKKKSYGLDIFWYLMQDNNSVSSAISEKAYECLVNLMEKEEFECERKKYMKLCVENLQSSFSVPQSLSLLIRIISKYNIPDKKKKNTAIDFLQEFKILDVFFDDLASLKKNKKIKDNEAPKRTTVESPKDEKKKDDQSFALGALGKKELSEQDSLLKDLRDLTPEQKSNMTNRFKYEQQVQSRMDFLSFLLRHSSLSLTFDQTLKLWKILYEDPICIEDRELCLTWLEHARSSHLDFLAEGVTEKLFNEVILTVEPDDMSLVHYQLFHTYFVSINVKCNKLEVIYEQDEKQQPEAKPVYKITNIIRKPKHTRNDRKIKEYVVLDNDLIGIDYLWKIIMQAKNDDVARKAIKYLNHLKNEFSHDMQALVSEFRQQYIQTCFDKLAAASMQKSNEIQILRCLDLLLNYVYMFSEKTGIKGHGLSSAGYQVKIKTVLFNGQKLMRTFHSTETIGKLRQIVSVELKQPPQFVSLYTMGKELNQDQDDKTFNELAFKENQFVLAKKADIADLGVQLVSFQLKALGLEPVADALTKQSLENYFMKMRSSSNYAELERYHSNNAESLDDFVVVSSSEDENAYPTKIISQDVYFSKLISMLDFNDAVAQRTWNLLLHLPTNEGMFRSVKKILESFDNQQVNWKELLTQPYSTHKLLYVLQIIDLILKQNIAKNIDLNLWSSQFVKNGGLNLFVSIFLDFSVEQLSRTALHKECFALLLKVINTFLPAFATFNNGEIVKLVDKILQVILPVVCAEVDPLPSYNHSPTKIVKPATEEQFSTSAIEKTQLDSAQEVSMDWKVIDNTMNLLVTALSIDDNMFKTISEHRNLKSFLQHTLLLSEQKEIRAAVADGLLRLSSCVVKQNDAKEFFVRLLFTFIKEAAMNENTSAEYFSILTTLLNSISQNFEGKLPLVEVIEMILIRPIQETSASDPEDKLLVGLLNTARVLFKMHPSDLKEEFGSEKKMGLIQAIFYSCLFEVPTFSRADQRIPPKCKTKASRTAALALLCELCDSCPQNFEELITLTFSFLNRTERHRDFNFTPDSNEKSNLGFVGLRNLEATCYMNSLIQQFFMTVPFRKGLLSATLPDPKKDDNTSCLYQLQTMFGFLQDSKRRYFDTKRFADSFKDLEGNSVNVSQQHDASEFFNLLVDKIENALKGTRQEKLLKNVYGGVILNQLIYEDQISENPEPFNILSLEIKNKKNILESLDLYVNGEMLEGDNKYYSEKLGRHVDAQKRAIIRDLPNVLIFHLKRFDFDFQRMRNLKINDRCEFPQELDMLPYTQQGIYFKEKRDTSKLTKQDPSYFKYKLVGVLVHMGSADSGHYYSYINDRFNKEGKWFEYNDSLIAKFDTSQLDKECFGGYVEYDTGTTKTKIYRKNNAYMLFYQRTNCLEAELFNDEGLTAQQLSGNIINNIMESQEQPQQQNVSVEVNEKEDNKARLSALIAKQREARQDPINVHSLDMAKEIKLQVLDDNSQFYYDKYFYGSEFYEYVWNLIHLIPNNGNSALELNAIQFAIRFLVTVIGHSRDVEQIATKWCNYLLNIISNNERACRTVLEMFAAHPSTWLQDVLLRCPIAEIRQGFAALFNKAITVVSAVEPIVVVVGDTQLVQNTGELPKTSLVNIFMESLLKLFFEIRVYRHVSEFLSILHHVVQMGYQERKYCSRNGIIANLVNMLNGDNNYATSSYMTRTRSWGMAYSYSKQAVHTALSIIALIVQTCEGNTKLPLDQLPPTSLRGQDTLELMAQDRDKLFAKVFFASLISEGENPKAVHDIIVHWCWKNATISSRIASLISEKVIPSTMFLDSSDIDIMRNNLNALEVLINIDDDLKIQRSTEALDLFWKQLQTAPVNQYGPTNNDPMFICLSFLMRWAEKYPLVKQWVQAKRVQIEALSKEHSISVRIHDSQSPPPQQPAPSNSTNNPAKPPQQQ